MKSKLSEGTKPSALREMIEAQISARGIDCPEVLQALDATPRDLFVREEQKPLAFADRPLPIGEGQTISQPYIVALMTSLLQLQPTDRVLEIGTGSGYQTAVLARLAARVYTIERIASLSHRAAAKLGELGIHNVDFRIGDGSLGWPDAAPFDRIIITAGAPVIPKPLYEQLKEGGRMVLPVGPETDQSLRVVERLGDRCVEHPGIPVRFVPLIGEYGFHGT